MPREWVSASSNYRAASSRGWQAVQVNGEIFLLPPKSYWNVLFSDRELSTLVEAGIAVSAAPIQNGAFTVDDIRHIFLDACPQMFRLREDAFIFSPSDSSAAYTPEGIRQFVGEGGTLVHSEGDLFLVPPSLIRPDGVSEDKMPDAVPADVLRRLAELGVIGLRGTHRAPWWQPLALVQPTTSRSEKTTPRPSSPDMNLAEFELRQYERWTTPRPVVDLKQFPELNQFPELHNWLWEHIPFVEPMDVRRIVNYLRIAESVTTVEHLNIILNFIHGIMAEVEIRPEIVAHYQKLLEENPSLILVMSPQFFSSDIREASDAMIGELVTRDGKSVLVIHALWEVTSHATGIRAAKIQMDHTVHDRLQDGVYIWSADRQAGLRLPVELALAGAHDIHTDVAQVNGARARVLQETRDQLLTTFLLNWNGTTAENRSRPMGTFQELMRIVRAEVAAGNLWSLSEFTKALHIADERRAKILENITIPREGGPLSKRDVAKSLSMHEQVVGRMEEELRVICREMGWPVLAHAGTSRDIEQGHDRRRDLNALKVRALAEQWDATRMIQEMKTAGLGQDATLLHNIVAPEGGRRRTTIEIAKQLGIDPPTNVYGWETRLEEMCGDLKWPMVDAPKQTRSEAMVAGQRARRVFDELWGRSLVEGWSRAVFLNVLETVDEARATVVRNVTEGFDGRRLSPAELHERFGLDHQVATNWEEAFEPLCQGRGWAVLPRPAETLQHGTRVRGGQELSEKVNALQSEARANGMARPQFAQRLRDLDPVRGAVWDRIVHPSGKPATNRELAAELDVPKSNIGKFAGELRDFSTEMGWQPATPNASPIGTGDGGGITLAPDADQIDKQRMTLAPKPGGFDITTIKIEPMTTPADAPQIDTSLPGTSLNEAPISTTEEFPMLSPEDWKNWAIPPSVGRARATGRGRNAVEAPEEIPLSIGLPEEAVPPGLPPILLPRVELTPATVVLLAAAGILVVADGPLPFGDAAAASLLGGRLALN